MNSIPVDIEGQSGRVCQILLADDDSDDCLFFGIALKELFINAKLTCVHDGEKLMKYLHENELPDIVYLDLNMPRKNGLECLKEIRLDMRLRSLPVIAISTSSSVVTRKQLLENGALHFIRKPNIFSELKEAIVYSLSLLTEGSRHCLPKSPPPHITIIVYPNNFYESRFSKPQG